MGAMLDLFTTVTFAANLTPFAIQNTRASRSMRYRPNARGGEGPPRDVFRAPRGRTHALESGQGVYRRDRAIQTAYIRNTCAPVPRPVSHMHAAAAVGAGSVSEMTQGYKYYESKNRAPTL